MNGGLINFGSSEDLVLPSAYSFGGFVQVRTANSVCTGTPEDPSLSCELQILAQNEQTLAVGHE